MAKSCLFALGTIYPSQCCTISQCCIILQENHDCHLSSLQCQLDTGARFIIGPKMCRVPIILVSCFHIVSVNITSNTSHIEGNYSGWKIFWPLVSLHWLKIILFPIIITKILLQQNITAVIKMSFSQVSEQFIVKGVNSKV